MILDLKTKISSSTYILTQISQRSGRKRRNDSRKYSVGSCCDIIGLVAPRAGKSLASAFDVSSARCVSGWTTESEAVENCFPFDATSFVRRSGRSSFPELTCHVVAPCSSTGFSQVFPLVSTTAPSSRQERRLEQDRGKEFNLQLARFQVWPYRALPSTRWTAWRRRMTFFRIYHRWYCNMNGGQSASSAARCRTQFYKSLTCMTMLDLFDCSVLAAL
jgi:hypothetical protein